VRENPHRQLFSHVALLSFVFFYYCTLEERFFQGRGCKKEREVLLRALF
jgi:hypothetical protein